MKTNQYIRTLQLAGILLGLVWTSACQREVNIDLDKGLSSQIQQIVPPAILDSLRKRGFVINEGLLPPQLAGNYLVSPNTLQTPYGPDDSYKVGRVISDYYFRFYGQTAANAITYDYSTTTKSDAGKGKGAFISGNGSKFTIFSQDEGVSSNIPNKALTVISGEVTDTGIKGWQESFVLTEKTGDSGNTVLIAVGKGRTFRDGDGLAAKTTFFPQSVRPAPGTASELLMSVPNPAAKNSVQ